MKILILSALYDPYLLGGAEKAATLLAEALAADGHEVSVITLHPQKHESVEQLHGVRIYRLPLDNLYWPFQRERAASRWHKTLWHLQDIWNWRAARRIGRILDIEKPQVVHSHAIAGFSAAAFSEIKRRKIRLVHTLHDYYLICWRSSMFRGGRACSERCATCTASTLPRRLASQGIDAVIPVSRYLLDLHRAAGYLKEIPAKVVPNLNAFFDARLQHPAEAQAHEGPIIFGYIGRVEPQKGIEVLLEACLCLLGDWKLRVAGHSSETYLRQLQSSYADPRIEWLGFCNARIFYQSIDVCIVPSLWPEPQPYVVIEALDAGKSIIASNSGGLPEMAGLAKRFLTFSTGNAEELASIMSEAQSNPEEWRQGGFRSDEVRRRFQVQQILAAHYTLYAQSESVSK